MAEKSSIVPLTGSNYPTWKVQCKMSLMKDGLWCIVNGTETAPTEGPAERYQKFATRRDRALATIVLSIHPSLLYLIGDPKDPVAVWNLLGGQFQKATWANKLALRRRLHSLRLKDGESVHEHVKAITEIFNELAVIGDNVDEEDRVVYLLASLPDCYDMLVTALEANIDVPDMKTVTERLLHEERKKKDRDAVPETSKEEVLVTRPQKKRGPRCHFCKRFGHIQRNCREKERKSSSEGSTVNPSAVGKKHRVYCAEANGQPVDSDTDEIGFVVRHALSTGVEVPSTLAGNWIVDSGSTSHICNDRNSFVDLQSLAKPIDVSLGDGHVLKAIARGTVYLTLKTGHLTRRCKLHDVLFVPDISYNLLSVSKAVEKGISFAFNERGCVLKNPKGKLITVARKIGSLYCVMYEEPKDHVHHTVAEKLSNSCKQSKQHLWHRRYGHLGVNNLRRLAKEKLVDEFDYCVSKPIDFCEPCLKGKHQRSRFPPCSERKTTKPLELVHSDVCGKLESKSLGGAQYFVTFIDDMTKYVWVYAIKHKSDVFKKFCQWKTEVEKLLGHCVKTVRTDNGGEYTSKEFEEYLGNEGVRHELTVPKCPEQNGVAERTNRTLVEMVRAMLADSGLPKLFWAEALATAVYLRNRCPTKSVEGKTPFEALCCHKPKVGHLRVFGCTAYSHIPKDERKKLDNKARKCIFLGYSTNRKGYRLYDPERQRIVYSRDVKFNESESGIEKFSSEKSAESQAITDSSKDMGMDEDDDSLREETEEPETDGDTESCVNEGNESITVRRSTRVSRQPDFYGVWVNSVNGVIEPHTVKEALSSSEKENWQEAMQDEFKSLCANNVWELVKPPDDRKVINSKWIFKCKLKENGLVERYKARLVAQGCSQREGLDYEETFSPVVRFESIRTVIALAVSEKMKLHQLDVKTAFLNGELTEEVFMRQPEGFVEPGKENLVCRLNRSIYGLKQSPRCWNTALDDHLKSMKFKQTKGDPCLYVSTQEEPVVIAVYVDDILIAGKTDEKIAEVKTALSNRFDVKDMGELHYFLGVKIVQDHKKGTIWMGQPLYTDTLISTFNMQDAKTCKTPANPSIKLTKASDDSTYVDMEEYQSAVGKLIYLSTRTRPDIAYAVSSVAKFTSKPTSQHWTAVKHILRYLAGTSNYGLLFTGSKSNVCTGYSDADWGGDVNDRKSTSGYLFKMCGGSVSWRSKKQSCVALSTAEAEYMSLASAAQEAIWLSRLITELHRSDTPKPAIVYEDNQSAICMTKNPQFHGRSKHIAIKYHFIRDETKQGTIDVRYCRSNDMIADMLTKGLCAEQFMKLREMTGVMELQSNQSEKEC